jgi:hypothetical protein
LRYPATISVVTARYHSRSRQRNRERSRISPCAYSWWERAAFARIAARRPFAELVIADYDLGRAQRAAAARDGYQAVQLDARDEQAVVGLLAQHRCDVLMNATDPRFVMPLFRAALQAGTHYLDMAMSLSYPHPDEPYRRTGVKLGDEQFALAPEWERSGRLALVGMGVEPGLSAQARPGLHRPGTRRRHQRVAARRGGRVSAGPGRPG